MNIENAIKYLSSKETFTFLSSKELEEIIKKYGDYGITKELILEYANKKIRVQNKYTDGSYHIIGDTYNFNWPWWVFKTNDNGQLEFDF